MTTYILYRWRPWPIKVHVWGGLGSQLHGYFLIERLKEISPEQKFVFVHHEYKDYPHRLSNFSPEIKELFPNQKYRTVENLTLPSKIKAKEIAKKLPGERVLVFFLEFIKVFARYLMYLIGVFWEPKPNLINSMPLLCSNIVGHYTQLKFPKVFFEELISILILDTVTPDVFLHYRSGDLEIFNKERIDFRKIENILRGICKSTPTALEVHTEDLEQTRTLFRSLELNLVTNFTSIDIGAANLLARGVHAKYFIGTNSKLSAWIAMLRCILGNNEKTFLPSSLQTYFIDFRPTDCALNPHYY